MFWLLWKSTECNWSTLFSETLQVYMYTEFYVIWNRNKPNANVLDRLAHSKSYQMSDNSKELLQNEMIRNGDPVQWLQLSEIRASRPAASVSMLEHL